jgi:Ni,Fe-hydrogenase I large subunit
VQQAYDPIPGQLRISPYNPHPESVLGFIGRPDDFARWQLGGYLNTELPLWAQAGVPGAGPGWKEYTGTMLFDVVAAAHLFPEYFWIGTGACRFLAWGIYEGAGPEFGHGTPGTYYYNDERLCHRARTHVRPSTAPGGEPAVNLQLWNRKAQHFNHQGVSYQDPVDPKNVVQEYTGNSWYDDDSLWLGRHMWATVTNPNPDNPAKPNAYTFAKTPRYFNTHADSTHPTYDWIPYEVGPLARMYANLPGLSIPLSPAQLNAVLRGDRMAYYPGVLNHAGYGLLPDYGAAPPAGNPYPGVLYGNFPNLTGYKSNYCGDATLDRIAARALETLYLARHLTTWLGMLDPTKPQNVTQQFAWGGVTDKTAPLKSYGAGLTEAPRGALGHWIRIGKKRNKPNWTKFKGKTFIYQVITPTAWNVSPMDHNGTHGPIEESIMGTPIQDHNEPIEINRIVHSFDPCIACTVHVSNAKGEKVAKCVLESTA